MTDIAAPAPRSLTHVKLSQAINYHQRGQLQAAEDLYVSILLDEPSHADAYHMLGLIAHQRRDFPLARERIEQAIRLNPRSAPYYSNLGATLRELSQPALALEAYSRAIELKPDYAEAYNNRGNALRALGKSNDAAVNFQRATEIRPNYVDAYINWAMALLDSQQLTEAIRLVERALKIQPSHWHAWQTLGDLQRQDREFDAAVASYTQAITLIDDPDLRLRRAETLIALERLDEARSDCESCLSRQPDSARALYLRGFIQQKQQQIDLAIIDYDLSLLFDPNNAMAYHYRGLARAAMGQYELALQDYDKSIALLPQQPDSHCHRGTVLSKLGQLEDAVAAFDEAIRLDPNHAIAHVQRGNVRVKTGMAQLALTDYQKAISIQPNNADFFFNQGHALHEAGQLQAALTSYRRALEIEPNNKSAQNNIAALYQTLDRLEDAFYHLDRAIELGHTEARWNKGVALLLRGDYAAGWPLYEARWEAGLGLVHTPFVEPRWMGREDLTGKTILLHPEQGFGDSIQFFRYAPLVADLGANVILEVPPRLMTLARTLRGIHTVIACGDDRPPFDFHCPLLSLPLAFQTTLESIPADIPYLATTHERAEEWKQILGHKRRQRIGIVWRGSAQNKNDRYRSMRLEELIPILDYEADFFSIQKDVTDGEKVILAKHGVRDLSAEQRDFADAAAICQLMDLVISVDTAVAHLAGAVGSRVWILLCHAPDWRWLLHRADCPWYPTATLIRQPNLNDWETPVKLIRQMLDER